MSVKRYTIVSKLALYTFTFILLTQETLPDLTTLQFLASGPVRPLNL